MAEQVVSVALETIRDLLVEEAVFLCGVKDEVTQLEQQLMFLKSYLIDADAKSHEEERVHIWLKQAKRISYKTEDVVEAYTMKVSSRKGRRGFKQMARRVACILGECATVHKVGMEISNINKEIADLIANLQSFGISQIIESEPSTEEIQNRRRLRMTYGHEVQQYFVGMDDDIKKLVSWAVDDNMSHQVITICGIGGLGKTTLARKVYNHGRVKERFDAFAWVCITQQCQPKSIMKDLLSQLVGDNNSDMEETEMVRKLFEFQKETKCLVVLDDIWSLSDWKILHHAFPITEHSNNSKILVTTRISEVAEVAHPSAQHKPSCLDKEDGFKLLKMTSLLNQGETVPISVEKILMDIVEKCGGLPLAISTIGGILRNKNPGTEWEWVNKEIDKYLMKNEGVINILALSYDALPSYLKPCFLYMGLFREDEDIYTTHLYHLWIAEGFLSSRKRKHNNESLMDVAQENLKELASRNMVQVDIDDLVTPVSMIRSCKLHDLMRDLCLTKGKEESFAQTKSVATDGVVTSFSGDQESCRLSILMELKDTFEDINLGQATNGYLRTVYVSVQELNCPVIEGSINLKMLRSLILDNCLFKDEKFPKEIKDMIHLRLLSVNYCFFEELPSFVGDLANLQILCVDVDSCIFPDIFYKLKKLRYLKLPIGDSFSELPSVEEKRFRFNGINELESFYGFDSRYHQTTDLSRLVNIRVFEGSIFGYEMMTTFLEQISYWQKLRFIYVIVNLDLDVPSSQIEKNFIIAKELFMLSIECHLFLTFPIGKLPRYEPQLCCNLCRLLLSNTMIEEDPMQFLKELPNLRDLSLLENSFLGKEMSCDSKTFPKLKSINFDSLPNIEIWKLDAGAMPNLSSIDIEECKHFEIIPDGFNNLTSIRYMRIFKMSDEFEQKYRKFPSSN